MKLYVTLSGGFANNYFQELAGIHFSMHLDRHITFLDLGIKSRNSINRTLERPRLEYPMRTTRATYLKPFIQLLHRIARLKRLRNLLCLLGVVISNDINDDLKWLGSTTRIWLISGHFQNQHFYRSIPEDIRFPSNLVKKTDLLENITVAHFRYGDYRDIKNPQGLLDTSYYLTALSRIVSRKNQHVLVLSDEPSSASQNLEAASKELLVSTSANPTNSVLLDLSIMISSKNLICANSSLSLMAGLLNGVNGHIYIPEPFYKSAPFSVSNFPQEWIRIPANFCTFEV